MLEKEIEKRIYKQPGAWITLKIYERHWPDRLFFGTNGKVIFIEFKRPKAKQSKGQAIYSRILEASGFPVYVIDNEDELKEILKKEFGE